MDIVKKNLFSIICGVIAIIAVVVVMLPINGKFAELKEEANKRKAIYESLKGLDSKARTLPVTTLDSAEAPKPLDMFPTDAAVKRAEEATEKFKGESTKMLAAAVEMNRHTPLVPKLFPVPESQVQQFTFRSEYQRAMEFMNGEVGGSSFVWSLLKAGLPPTEADIVKARDLKKMQIEQQMLKYGNDGQPLNGADVAVAITDALAKIPENLRNSTASHSHIYISPDALDMYAGITTVAQAPEMKDIFLAQVGLWIQQDIAAGIAEANGQSTTVLDSAVKHLIKIDIPDDPFLHGAPLAGAAPTADAGFTAETGGDPAAAGATGVIDPTVSMLTKRKAGDLYDIATFRLVMNVDGTRIPEVLAALARNRFITVQEIQIQSVDPSGPLAAGYLYGKQPVVTLTLRCEQLFLREWLKPLMPPRIKALLGIAA